MLLVLLAVLHIYWMFGGRWGKAAAIPEVYGRRAFDPSPRATFLAATGLLFAAVVALLRGHVIFPFLPAILVQWVLIAIGIIFVLRSIGDFRLVGFFKRVQGTSFARRDTWLFSPLSLLIGVTFLSLAAQP
jgi:hypothetical protein